MKLVVGLGNPGPQYEHTRHNAGADFVTSLAEHHGTRFKKENKFSGETARITLNGQDIRLLRPLTYMNLSGQALGPMAKFYNIPPEAILVAHDELDIEPGQARLKIGGGHGGHNGLKDIIKALGNNKNFARLRIGVGHPGHASEVVSYVLRRAPQSEQQLIEDSIKAALQIAPELAEGQWNKAMKALHTK
ncbi:MAG: aminoacyl-tRNA hydrolase [Porticoccaceae bacterium]|nr:aminoacyl-tRNA hydrolase [Porticoccaceae bacterium]